MKLRPFQAKFVREAFRDHIDTAALSIPRGNGKSALAGHILSRCMVPGDELNQAGKEYILVASSLEQARIVYGFIRGELEGNEEYRWLDSSTRIGVLHKPSNTRLRVLSSKAKSAFGIVGCPLLILDEPGSLETVGGTLLADAIFSAMGKPGSRLKVLLIGTQSPASSGWWIDLVNGGTTGSTYVQALKGDPKKWDKWTEIRRCNPLTAISDGFKAKLLDERNKARRDTRLKARFCSYRLNVPTGDEETMLLTVDDYATLTKRAVPPRKVCQSWRSISAARGLGLRLVVSTKTEESKPARSRLVCLVWPIRRPVITCRVGPINGWPIKASWFKRRGFASPRQVC